MRADSREECELGPSDKQICSINVPSTVNFHIWTQYYGSHTKQKKDRISVNWVYNRKKKKESIIQFTHYVDQDFISNSYACPISFNCNSVQPMAKRHTLEALRD